MRTPRHGVLRRVRACCTTALFLVSGPSYAECVVDLTQARAIARVLSCQSLEIGPSNTKISSSKEASAEREGPGYFDDQTAKFSGTLLFVELLTDASDPRGRVTNWPADWRKGSELPLVSSQPASELCKIESTVKVMPDQVCCDTIPRRGKCIWPWGLKIQHALISPTQELSR